MGKLWLLTGIFMLIGCSDEFESPNMTVSQLLSNPSPKGYERVTQPRQFSFPEDHGAHLNYATEWWYLTGNLEDEVGRQFGYQFTLFRMAMDKSIPQSSSKWRASNLYMAHLALSDIKGNKHLQGERFSRGSAGIAGVTTSPFKAWLGGWSLSGLGSPFPLKLQAKEKNFSIEFEILEGTKPITLQGNQGLSQKSLGKGNASYYYSMTRLPTKGTIRIGHDQLNVRGQSWLDREWSSSALDKGQSGWDWFALQLDDGRDLMFYRLRTLNQEMHEFSRGSLVDRLGNKTDISHRDIELIPLTWWQSEKQEQYPISWRLKIPTQNIDIRVTAVINDQLMRTRVRYWEGAVIVDGSQSGRGYMELSGYANKIQNASN